MALQSEPWFESDLSYVSFLGQLFWAIEMQVVLICQGK